MPHVERSYPDTPEYFVMSLVHRDVGKAVQFTLR